LPDEAETITRQLLTEGLIVCADLLEVDSIYRWEGEIVEDEEVLALCRLLEGNMDAVRDRPAGRHLCDVLCIVSYESVDALPAYADRCAVGPD